MAFLTQQYKDEALRLREKGFSTRAIAKALGDVVSYQTINRWVNAAKNKIAAQEAAIDSRFQSEKTAKTTNLL